MTHRAALIDQWRARLAQLQAELAEMDQRGRSGSFNWLRRTYVRVFTFLLAQYGDGQSAVDGSLPTIGTEPPSAEPREKPGWGLALLDANHPETPPKSADRIRGTLTRLHAEVPPKRAGPLRGGLGNKDRVVLGLYRRFVEALARRSYLRARGIAAGVAFYGDRWKLDVPQDERERAEQVMRGECDDHEWTNRALVAAIRRQDIGFAIAAILVPLIALVSIVLAAR